MIRRRGRKAKWGCVVVLLLFAAVCCAAPVGNAISAYGALKTAAQEDGGIAEGGSAADIPPRMLAAYKKAVQQVGKHVPKCQGMRWPILAGIAKVESNHAVGRNIADNGDIRPKIYGVLLNGSGVGGNTSVIPDTDGGKWDSRSQGERAVGPFQFLPSTWEGVWKHSGGAKAADPHNADYAALGATIYLCGNDRDLTKRAQLKAAIWQYNQSGEYVANVLGWIDQYTADAEDPDLKNVTGKVRTVIEAALSQRGVPYSWGGGNAKGKSTGSCCSPSGKSGTGIKGFDCSGLTQYAYAKAGVSLPRVAFAQAGVGQRIPASLGTLALKPGDLVFFATAPGRDDLSRGHLPGQRADGERPQTGDGGPPGRREHHVRLRGGSEAPVTTPPARSPRLLIVGAVLLVVAGIVLLVVPRGKEPPAPVTSSTVTANQASAVSKPPADKSTASASVSTTPAVPTPSVLQSALPPHGEGAAGDRAVQQSLEAAWPSDLPTADEQQLLTAGRALLRADATGAGRTKWPDVFPDTDQAVAPAFATVRFRIQAAIARRGGSSGKAVVHLVWAGTDRGGTYTDLRSTDLFFTRTLKKGEPTWTPQPRI
ncbi:NlpC/P60 family protein [Streptomyces phaeochromogenes]|uniref:C40 family peptidase n=1 Tax=Streptomyces phaeochromogenes TaxID=1923 RepID=UPI0033D2E7D8